MKRQAKEKRFAPATALVRAGRAPGLAAGIVNPPVYHASTCLFDSLAALDERIAAPDEGLYYGRRGTPTHWALQDALTSIEPGAAGTQLFPSGVAALASALLSVCRGGDHLLMADSVYEPTRGLAAGLLKGLNIETEFYDPAIADITPLFRENTRALFLESPGSLTLDMQDVPGLARAARTAGIVTILDNTWATPLLFPAIERGVDIAVQSLTKFVIGHSDALMGSVSANEALWPRVSTMAKRLGQNAGPDDVFLALRGLRTLGLRLARHGDSALRTAAELKEHPAVAHVLCPGLPEAQGHDIWQRDFAGYSSLFSIVLAGGKRADLAAMIDDLTHFGIGFSFGGYESLVLPVRPETVRSASQWEAPGPVLRIHIGLEDADELIDDLRKGLDRFASRAAL